MSITLAGCDDEQSRASRRDRVAANGAVVRRFLAEVLPGGSAAAFADVLAPDHVQYGPASYQTFVGVDETRGAARRLTTAFPDLAVTVTDVLSVGDLVRANGRMRGRHTGDLVFGDATFGPTGRAASWRITLQCRVADGRIAETRVGMDRTGLARQLGLGHATASPLLDAVGGE